jgi:hypothetical protein
MSPSDPDISYFRLPRGIDRKSIGQFMTAVRDRVLRGRTFACLITTDAELQRLNRTFRRKDYATDVLSFPFVPVENGSRKLRKNAPASGRGRLNACPTVEGTAPLEAVKKSKPAGETACATDASYLLSMVERAVSPASAKTKQAVPNWQRCYLTAPDRASHSWLSRLGGTAR